MKNYILKNNLVKVLNNIFEANINKKVNLFVVVFSKFRNVIFENTDVIKVEI
jgi:hypothetical protein